MSIQKVIPEARSKRDQRVELSAATAINALIDGLAANTSNSMKIINSEEDFPAAVDGVITLENNITYVMGASVTTSNRFVGGVNNKITSFNPFYPTLIYTGTGTMFTTVDNNFILDNIAVYATDLNSILMECSSPTSNGNTIGFNIVTIVGCGKVGYFNDLRSLNLYNVNFLNIQDGFTFQGTTKWRSASLIKLNMTTTSGTCKFLELGTSLHREFELSNGLFSGDSSAIGLSGLPNSGNITSGGSLTVNDSIMSDLTTPLAGITEFDIRSSFRDNSANLFNSRNAVDAYLANGSKTISIITAGTFYEIGVPTGGVFWDSDVEYRFTVGTDGVITYTGERPIQVQVFAIATVQKSGGGADVIEVRLAKNWTAGSTGIYKSRSQTQNATPTSVPVGALVSLVQGDNLRLIFANNTTTSSIIVNVTSIQVID